MTIELFAVLWGSVVGFALGTACTIAFLKPTTSRSAHWLGPWLDRITPSWLPISRRASFLVGAVILFGLATGALVIFVRSLIGVK